MKILHTADWHIGKILHKHSLEHEMNLFFDWMIETIKEEAVDLLLVSGDIFDFANPSVRDNEIYYHVLSRLIACDIQVIITGGNHDSVGRLNAPKDLLTALNISVVGGAKENINDELIEVKNSQGKLEVVVAAVPFLRDKDLRRKDYNHKYSNRTEAIREGIKAHYAALAAMCEEKYKDIPVIAMGHLYAKGVTESDSERDIHVGNAAAVDASIFTQVFDYVALGHIHRPQIVAKNEYIRFSGSPIALSFSEKEDSKSMVLLEVENGNNVSLEVITIPKSRELKKITGNLDTVKNKLAKYNPDFPLTSFVELEVNEDQFSSVIIAQVDDLITEYSENEKFRILKGPINFQSGARDTADLFVEGTHVEDLKPIDVFFKRLEQEEISDETENILKEAFLELLETVDLSESL